MERRKFLRTMACLPLYGLCPAARIGSQDTPRFDTRTILLLRSDVAGMRYNRGEKVLPMINPGDAVMLIREPDNPHDRKAVALYWKGEKLGYIPRVDNSVIANLLDQGAPVKAIVRKKAQGVCPRERLRVEVVLDG